MALPNDPNRFYDLNGHVLLLIRIQLGIDPPPRTEQEKKWYAEEWRLLLEQYKGLGDIFNSLLANGLNAQAIYAYCQLAAKVSQRHTGFMHIMRMTLDVATTNKAAANTLITVARGAGAVSPRLIAAAKGSVVFLAAVTALGCVIHISRGDWPRALGDIAKTALSLMSTPAAFVDLVFGILEAVMPYQISSSPFWRLFRTSNVLQTNATVFETITGLAYCLGFAYQRDWSGFNTELGKVMDRFDRSPLSVWTEFGQGLAVILTTLFPSTRRWGIGYATLGSLVDYSDQNRTLQSWY